MFLQFELWKQCSFGCKFCYNNGIPRRRNKVDTLKKVINILQSEEANDYDNFGIIGGEFFNGEIDTEEVHEYFYKLIDVFIDKLRTNKAKRCLINTALMFDDTKDLFEFCNYIKDYKVEDKFLLCTSWDNLGRFNDETLKNWENNMSLLYRNYPDLKLHVEMIITEAFLQAVLNKSLNLKEFNEKYHCYTNYMLPMIGHGGLYKNITEFEAKLPGFFPKRDSFLKFLQYVYETEMFSLNDFKNLINIVNHSDTCYTSTDDIDFFKITDRHKYEYNKNRFFKNDGYGYVDSDIHPREDVDTFLSMIEE